MTIIFANAKVFAMNKTRIRGQNYPKGLGTTTTGIIFPTAEWAALDAIAAELGVSRTRLLLIASIHFREKVLVKHTASAERDALVSRTLARYVNVA